MKHVSSFEVRIDRQDIRAIRQKATRNYVFA